MTTDHDRTALVRGSTVGRYVLLDRIGAGGVGEVYSAYDPELDRKVAIKLLLRETAHTKVGDFEERLVREAQAMARVSHPNVLPIYDVGISEGRVFLTMELVHGVTLRHWRLETNPTFRAIVNAYIAAGRGLAAAHAAGLVHRDFKPDNVLVADDGSVKVMDFGIARAVHDDGVAQAAASDDESDPSADTQSKGVVLPTVRLPRGFVGYDGGAIAARLLANTDDDDDERELPSSRRDAAREPQNPASVRDPESSHGSVGRMRVSTRPSGLGSPLTSEGVILGTPGYMAPEQYRAEPADPRTDQFAFCVALYEALYGERPFAAGSLSDLRDAVVTGRLRTPPKGVSVPPWMRRVLLRGLSVSREARFESMNALLEALSHDASGRRFRAVVIAASAVVSLTVGALGYRAAKPAAVPVCGGGRALIASAWNAETRDQARAAFLATDRPFAAQAFQQASATLDSYATRWADMHGETCTATRVRGEQSELTMGLRMACLEERRRDVVALAALFTSADGDVVDGAAQAARRLPSLAPCGNGATLASVVPLPEDAATRAQIESLQTELAALEAQLHAGAVRGASERAQRLARGVEVAHHDPLTADAYSAIAALHVSSGEFAEAATMYKRALWAAERGHADTAKERALVGIAFALGELGKFAEARDYVRLAEAVGARLGRDAFAETERLSTDGWLSFREGNYADAVSTLRRAVATAERFRETDPATLGLLYNRLASSLLHRRAYDEALVLLGKEDALIIADQGEDHPARIHNLVDTSAVLLEARRFGEVVTLLTRALAIASRAGLRSSAAVVFALNNFGEAELGLNRPAGALAHFDDALGLATKEYGADHWVVGALRVNRARALLDLGRPGEALVDADLGLHALEGTLPDGHDLLGRALATVGEAHLAECHPGRAIPPLTRAQGIVEHHPTGDELGRVRFALARGLWGTGDRSPHVRQLALGAREAYRDVDARTGVSDVDQWLTSPPPCRPGG